MDPRTPAQPSDAELVQAMARGDASALGQLYDRHAPVMLALAARIFRRGAEVEDLVQEVFLETWRRAADYDPKRASVRGWLLLRTRSRALDLKKSARISRQVGNGDSAWFEQLSDPSADTALGAERGQLERALLTLSAEQRQVLQLGYFEGLSSSEMAERLEIPLGTVKSRVAAAMAQLRSALALR
ncbi:MAG TPA: sigma-70 family RNA polymerase sigma factor [Polyangiales bacterium]|nr:sigma-70 family RNA polymerase sigma factor [Polyangiales bacterium]